MGATKEKRIKKLKKLQIWPAIVGLVLLMTISSFLIFLTGMVSISDIAQRKLVRAGEQAVRIAELYDQECDLIQGYFFAKPMPVEEYVEKYCGQP